MEPAIRMVTRDCKQYGVLPFTSDALNIHVHDTHTGLQLKSEDKDIYTMLSEFILKQSVHWPNTISKFCQHSKNGSGNGRVLAFGPGHGSGSMCSLTAQLLEGTFKIENNKNGI